MNLHALAVSLPGDIELRGSGLHSAEFSTAPGATISGPKQGPAFLIAHVEKVQLKDLSILGVHTGVINHYKAAPGGDIIFTQPCVFTILYRYSLSKYTEWYVNVFNAGGYYQAMLAAEQLKCRHVCPDIVCSCRWPRSRSTARRS